MRYYDPYSDEERSDEYDDYGDEYGEEVIEEEVEKAPVVLIAEEKEQKRERWMEHVRIHPEVVSFLVSILLGCHL